ncbi:MAG: solute-binding protein [Clostridia bacterium]|nr:solute-binding protein [Clostridia bacterium]
MRRQIKKILALLLVLTLLTGCDAISDEIRAHEKTDALSVTEARKELDSLLTKVKSTEIKDPQLDIYTDEISEAAALADIDTFDTPVDGNGQITIEIATATEFSSEAPDDWLVAVARNFNREKHELNGKSVAVTIRAITSGEILTYTKAGIYQPHAAVFSNDAWVKMSQASGIGIDVIEKRIAGNTAGILISKDASDTVNEKYGETTFATVIQATQDGTLTFGYPNPYTSSTGLNGLTAMLGLFDPSDPLSAKASSTLKNYQKTAPPVAYNTAVLRNQAKKGIVDTMLMEEQAYVNTPELSDYIYIPFGIRHDHPFCVFDWDTEEQKGAAELFAEYCLTDENQKLATEKGFNRHDDYKGEQGLSGQQYLTAQSLWKQNKNGGRPTAAVFIVDTSGSMKGEPLQELKKSVIDTLPYIGPENCVGLISYNSDVTVNLNMLETDENGKTVGLKAFDDRQRAYFSGEIKNLQATGNTATYDAVLVGLDMINQVQAIEPDATPLIILLTDGEAWGGYSLSRIETIVEGMRVPVYCIAYNYKDNGELEKLSGINEASTVRAESDDIVNQLRNLFNTQL